MFKVYVIKSLVIEKFYIGQTKDLNKRIKWHNSARARWTRRYQPWILVFSETYESRSDAMLRERELKTLKNIKQFLNI